VQPDGRHVEPTDERVVALKGLFDAFSRGGEAALGALNFLDPECALQGHPAVDSKWHHGHDGAAHWAVTYYEVFGSAQVEATEFIPLTDGRMIVRYVATARGKRSGAEVEMSGYGLFTFRGSKVLRAEAFETKAEALAAVGLSASG
jgi:ketosteroid isomerase-like protein